MNIKPHSLVSITARARRRTTSFSPLSSHLLPRNLSSLSSHLSLLHQRATSRHLPKAREIHALLLTSSLLSSSPPALTSLISLYSKCSSPAAALAAFRFSPSPPNLFAWNAAISALSSNFLPVDAFLLFRFLRSHPSLLPDRFTFPCVIKSLSDLGDAGDLKITHALLFKFGLDSDVFVSSAMVNAYLKVGFVEDAEKVFDDLPDRDVVLWNSMVNGFAQMGRFWIARQYFDRMVEEGMVPSRFTTTGILSVFTSTADFNSGRKIHAFVLKIGYGFDVAISNSLIDLYGKCHAVEDAEEVFESMLDRDIFSWNSIISAFIYSADHQKTLQLFGQMLPVGVQPDSITMAAIFSACSQLAALSHGRETHAYLLRHGITGDVLLYNSLMDMYAKCGALEDARKVFDEMPDNDVASWNIMIDACASHGLGEDALKLFTAMTAVPDEVTLVAVLSACSHSGLVQAGMKIFEEMKVMPAAEHYLCMVDMFGRAGMLEKAKEMALAAEKACGAKGWRAYIAACRESGEMERVVEAVERVVGMEPEGSGAWVMAANAYGWAGKYNEVEDLRGEMWRRGVKKVPGCSWVEVAGHGVHTFVTGERCHPRAQAIYAVIHELAGWIRDGGSLALVVLDGSWEML
ncbi:pentatricopeptide repeat-containing protein At3g14730-like [Phalaenopsis equestris]|uniref:pentatricopeptide repeat-containing protein At3g14730-like n=1 Tax=Phalaenopsis equestris TaxID=78828 RepID=UPI0009E327E7|nr:pentatricopeptide repeat-containing protein At3g14730-like [Phalaenopsis equestris]